MSAKTESTTRPRLSTLLKNKIGKLGKITSRSKSSPALIMIDSNIQESLVTIIKPVKSVKGQIPHCQQVIDLSQVYSFVYTYSS